MVFHKATQTYMFQFYFHHFLNTNQFLGVSLLDIDLNKLYNIQVEFEENKTQLLFDKEGSPFTRVDKNQFITFTKNDAENERLDVFQSFISSLEEMTKHTHIYKGSVAQMTSNALRFDLRLNKWRINPIYFR